MPGKQQKQDAGPSRPLWYKDAIIYELHVKAFCDSNGDGIGDFKGLTSKLDYLQDLGITAVWLLPFCPSPLKDDGYDISDYTAIHPNYGTMGDFKKFLREAHRRDLRVITELVLNHTSDRHPWFQRARRARPGTKWRDFYVWSDTPERYADTRIIFQDFETSNWTWDPVAKAYYWHRFYSHQPDLNYNNPLVQKAMFRAINFWFDLGVDGLRLDAVPYLFEREATNCENLPETYEFLRQLRAHVDQRFEEKVFLGEANQWPEDAIAYFGRGDMCHMAFHFPLMPRLFMGLRMEDRYPIIDIMEQTPQIPESCQWAVFLRNHDELTLEMVTDEERDYMYRVYAQDAQMRINLGIRRRLAPLLGNHRRRIELMNALLFSLPGSPIVYYGDEISMGDNVYLGDRDSVRTPMQWSADRNAGFSKANAQRLYLPAIIDPEYHYETVNVEAQQNNPHSLLWWTKRLIAIRKRSKAFGRGTLEFLHPENRKILSFVRRYQEESLLVVANLSRFVQYVELDLSDYRDATPVELFGATRFPPVGDGNYFLTIGPHSFYWFALVPPAGEGDEVEAPSAGFQPPILRVPGSWDSIFTGGTAEELERILAGFVLVQRWFGGKARRIKGVRIHDVMPMKRFGADASLVIIEVGYLEGDPEHYVLPLAYTSGEHSERIIREHLGSVVAFIQLGRNKEEGILYDAMLDPEFGRSLLGLIRRRRRVKGSLGELIGSATRAYGALARGREGMLEPSLMRREQTNTSVAYGERLIFKLFRRLTPGINPDLEIGRFLTGQGFPHIPPVAGAVEYLRGKEEAMTLGILEGYVPNQGDAWSYTLDELEGYFERLMTQRPDPARFSLPASKLDHLEEGLPPAVLEYTGTYVDAAERLGLLTAELHLALAEVGEDPAFRPEPFSKLYQRALYQSMRTLTGENFGALHKNLDRIPEDLRPLAARVLEKRQAVMSRFNAVVREKITAMRMRCHGDYHLGQVLYTGKDFVIMDFEGEPARPVSERKIKRSPLRDIAGMLRSFHYAAFSKLFSLNERGLVPVNERAATEFWARLWYGWICTAFLRSYLSRAQTGDFLPQTKAELQILLDVYLLEKAVYELGYELNNRPHWVKIPLEGIEQLLSKTEEPPLTQ